MSKHQWQRIRNSERYYSIYRHKLMKLHAQLHGTTLRSTSTSSDFASAFARSNDAETLIPNIRCSPITHAPMYYTII